MRRTHLSVRNVQVDDESFVVLPVHGRPGPSVNLNGKAVGLMAGKVRVEVWQQEGGETWTAPATFESQSNESGNQHKLAGKKEHTKRHEVQGKL